jgi:hypothetical protein
VELLAAEHDDEEPDDDDDEGSRFYGRHWQHILGFINPLNSPYCKILIDPFNQQLANFDF